jgi:cytolysin-activating lysine-acyltransferase
MPGDEKAAVLDEARPGDDSKVRLLQAHTKAVLESIGGLVPRPISRDAGANPQREDQSMAKISKDKKASTEAGSKTAPGAAAGQTAFDHPAPAGAAKKVSEVLGEIVWLMSQSALHKQFFISDLEWFVMTPIMLQQFRLFYDKDKPIGVAFWATVSAEVEERLAAGTSRLRPQDWKSGDRLWVVEVVAPFGGAEEMVKDLKAKVFAGRELKFLAVGEKGRELREL